MNQVQEDLATVFLEFSRHKLLRQYWPRLRKCVEPLSEAQVWWRPNPASNSIGNLILHLNGNVRQWLVASFSRLDDRRERQSEFDAREGIPAAKLLETLGATMREAEDVLARLTEADLVAAYVIQGYNVKGLDAVYQVVEHFGLHYGQIVYITKTVCGADLGFYSELRGTGRLGVGADGEMKGQQQP